MESSSICHQALYDYSILPDRQKFHVFKTKGVLSNLKFYHFHKNDLRPHNVRDRNKYIQYIKDPLEASKRKTTNYTRLSEGLSHINDSPTKQLEDVDVDELLIERQDHHCGFRKSIEDKAKHLEMAKENFLRDYRLIHSGLIDVALTQLKPSRKREVENLPHFLDFSPGGGKYGEMDDMDLDYLFDAEDAPEDGQFGVPGLGRNSSVQNKLQVQTGQQKGEPPVKGSKKTDLHILGEHAELNGSGEESSSSEEEPEQIYNPKKFERKPTSPTKRKDSGGGLFGFTEWDSDEEELTKKAFSFIDTNLDKYNVLNFIENQEHKVAPN